MQFKLNEHWSRLPADVFHRIADLIYFIPFSKAQFEFLEWEGKTEETGDCSKAHENGTKMDWSKACTPQGR